MVLLLCVVVVVFDEAFVSEVLSGLVGVVVLEREGFAHKIVCAVSHVALVESVSTLEGYNVPCHYEVWIVRRKHPSEFGNRWGLKWPGREDFGRLGWCYGDLDHARDKFWCVVESLDCGGGCV